MRRTDINQHDVFISWTGKDRALKDRIKDFLKKNDLRCLESDYGCSGDFRTWSYDAVHACSVFLLILTPATLNSAYVPVEIESFKHVEDFQNRIVPVCSSLELYQKEPWGISAFASAVILDNIATEEESMNAILRKVQRLLINQMDRIYREAMKPEYIKLIPFLQTDTVPDQQYQFEELYIYRSITERNSEQQAVGSYSSPEDLCRSNDILFLSGPAGIGKSRYVDQLRQVADQDTVTICLPCNKVADNTESLEVLLYREFCSCCGNVQIYTLEDFQGLLGNRYLLLVLDGIDEIATIEGTRKLIEKVERYYTAHHAHTTLLITGRNENDANLIAMAGKQVRHFVLDPLTDRDVFALSRKLFKLFGALDKCETFCERIMGLNNDIKTNPLLLSQLAIVYHDSGQIPRTVVGIYDAIVEINFKLDKTVTISHIPENYQVMVTQQIPEILKKFSAERYMLASEGKDIDVVKIFSKVLKETYGAERQMRAEYLVKYLQNRAIFVNGEFYHKTLLEYFTALYYYEKCFDDYDDLENICGINELFAHYGDSFWAAVIQLFLVKVDNSVSEQTAASFFQQLMTLGITEYTLLVETYLDLQQHGQRAQITVLSDILVKSVVGEYPPYGPLFWYVPQYGLYEELLLAADGLQGVTGFGKILSLVRDVCYIYGQLYTAGSVTSQVAGETLFRAAEPELQGVRAALCELFFVGHTDYEGGSDIYPRCFNVAEVRSFMEWDYGLATRFFNPFDDELGLYSHECYNLLNDEMIGFVACPYHKPKMINNFSQHQTQKVSGLALAPTINTVFTYLPIFRKNLKVIWFPENCTVHSMDYDLHLQLLYGHIWTEEYLLYAKHKLEFVVPGFIKELAEFALKSYADFERLVISEGVERLHRGALKGCCEIACLELPGSIEEFDIGRAVLKKLQRIIVPLEKLSFFVQTIESKYISEIREFPETHQAELLICVQPGARKVTHGVLSEFQGNTTLEEVDSTRAAQIVQSAFEGCVNLRKITLPASLLMLPQRTFKNCEKLVDIMMPMDLLEIGDEAFAGCTSLYRVYLPKTVICIGERAFQNCSALKKLFLPNGLETIKKQAFVGCSSLREILLPPTVISVAPDAFDDCKSLSCIRIPADMEVQLAVGPEVRRVIYYPKKKYYSKDTETNGIIVQSEVEVSCDEEMVLGKNLYRMRSHLRRISFGPDVTKIPSGCFSHCAALEQVNLSANIKTIGKEAFRGCNALTEVLPVCAIRTLGTRAFADCRSLERIDFNSNKLHHIGSSAFENCIGLKILKLPKSLRTIGHHAFSGCIGLTYIEISANFKEQIDSIFGSIDPSIIHYVY